MEKALHFMPSGECRRDRKGRKDHLSLRGIFQGGQQEHHPARSRNADVSADFHLRDFCRFKSAGQYPGTGLRRSDRLAVDTPKQKGSEPGLLPDAKTEKRQQETIKTHLEHLGGLRLDYSGAEHFVTVVPYGELARRNATLRGLEKNE